MPPGFWDYFVQRLFVGFGEGNPRDLLLAEELLQCARTQGLLAVANLRAESLIQITLACADHGPGSLYLEALHELFRMGNRGPAGWGRQLVDALPLPVDFLLAIALQGSRTQQLLIFQAIEERYRSPLLHFLTRWSLSEFSGERREAPRLLQLAFNQWGGQAAAYPTGFPCLLYTIVLGDRRTPAHAWPANEPAWVAAARQDPRLQPEVGFLDCGLQLPESQRALLYLFFYGQLNLNQIAEILSTGGVRIHRKHVRSALRHLWETILRCMAGGGATP